MGDETNLDKILTDEEKDLIVAQNSRLVPQFKANQLEEHAQKHWDLFYKRNENRFFKDRHWTTREFQDLLNEKYQCEKRVLFEIGCGTGNFIFPLIEAGLNFEIIACDLSKRAVEIVRRNKLYNKTFNVFVGDITVDNFDEVKSNSVDIATLIFVLSAIHPDKFIKTLKNIFDKLKPGGVLLFRDYGLYDMAQLRFKAGHKISENLYMRQDGTRCYYFSLDFIKNVMEKVGFEIISNVYVHRRTINKKEGVDVPRIFVQGKFQKSSSEKG
ncbi:tRNA N(3)-cytidine methyltransferase METTL6 [Onthophagus taurus]|uniref:tRNA N(3)-cytidine methyltransferase METTL6 n=1 Tax=Onthophagus taurus TaxID=166361 RepID=UPI000C20819D|nr:methyltransferase-like protein 6 [Onthophagus taurus]